MKMPDAWLKESVQTAMADTHSGKFAPFVLHGCILALTGGTLPQHLLVRARLDTGATQWRAVWLHAGTVGYARVTASVEGWGSYYEADHGAVTPEETIAWARSLRSMSQMSLTAARCTYQRVHGERHWSWVSGARLQFVDGEVVDLPLFGSAESVEEEGRVAAFLDAVASVVAGTPIDAAT